MSPAAAPPAAASQAVVPPAQLPPDVLSPEPVRWWFGPMAGVNLTTHDGTFTPLCDQCSFSDGSGAGVLLGARLERMMSPQWRWALSLAYQDMRASYDAVVPQKMSIVRNTTTNQVELVAVNYERSSDVQLAYLMLHPAIQFHPFRGVYLFAGPAAGLALTGTYRVTERIVDPGFVYPDTRSTEATIEEDTDIDRVSGTQTLRLDLRAGIGAELPLSRSVLLAPEVSYGYPLTGIAEFSGWSASAIHLAAVLKIAL